MCVNVTAAVLTKQFVDPVALGIDKIVLVRRQCSLLHIIYLFAWIYHRTTTVHTSLETTVARLLLLLLLLHLKPACPCAAPTTVAAVHAVSAVAECGC